jgi:quinol-cytochrome oxidoreductase complex cytochrome b subunit
MTLRFFALIVAILAVVILARHGASLEAPADPASGYPGRPEWYFLWLFELLKAFSRSYRSSTGGHRLRHARGGHTSRSRVASRWRCSP